MHLSALLGDAKVYPAYGHCKDEDACDCSCHCKWLLQLSQQRVVVRDLRGQHGGSNVSTHVDYAGVVLRASRLGQCHSVVTCRVKVGFVSRVGDAVDLEGCMHADVAGSQRDSLTCTALTIRLQATQLSLQPRPQQHP